MILLHVTVFRVLESLSAFLNGVILPENGTVNRTIFAFKTFALQVVEIDPHQFSGQTFTVNLGTVEDAMNITDKIQEDALVTSQIIMEILTNATASINIPENLINEQQSCELNTSVLYSQRLSYSVFLSDILFQDLNQSQYEEIGSIIIAAQLRCTDNDTSDMAPVQVTFSTETEVYHRHRLR